MKINGSYTFPAKADIVWDLLLDPQVLLQVIPGLQAVEFSASGDITATALVGIGPLKGTFSGKLQLLDQQKPTHVRIVGEGKGGPGFMKGTCIIDAVEQGDATIVNYQATIQIGGPLASVGQRLVDAATNSIMQQGFGAFNQVLVERQAAEAASAAALRQAQHAALAAAAPPELFPGWVAGALAVALSLLSLWVYFSHP